MIYKYIGIIEPEISAFGFVDSIFSDETETNIFIAVVNESNVVEGFREIGLFSSVKIKKVKSNFISKTYDEYIFSFMSLNKEVIFGTKNQIDFKLIGLLGNRHINSQGKLLISNFLNLYENTIDIIKEVNNDLEKLGILNKIDIDFLFSSKMDEHNIDERDLLYRIRQKFDLYDEYNIKLKDGDVLFFNEDSLYFENNEYSAEKLITRLSKSKLQKELNKALIASSFKNTININKLVTQNDEIYKYFLFSNELVFDQCSIEKHLSGLIEENNSLNSIIDVGIEMDNFYENMDNELIDNLKQKFEYILSNQLNTEQSLSKLNTENNSLNSFIAITKKDTETDKVFEILDVKIKTLEFVDKGNLQEDFNSLESSKKSIPSQISCLI